MTQQIYPMLVTNHPVGNAAYVLLNGDPSEPSPLTTVTVAWVTPGVPVTGSFHAPTATVLISHASFLALLDQLHNGAVNTQILVYADGSAVKDFNSYPVDKSVRAVAASAAASI